MTIAITVCFKRFGKTATADASESEMGTGCAGRRWRRAQSLVNRASQSPGLRTRALVGPYRKSTAALDQGEPLTRHARPGGVWGVGQS